MLATTTKLTMGGHEVDTSPGAFGELEDSSHLIGDVGALRARMAEEGYLFLRGYLYRDQVMAARLEVCRRLALMGQIDAEQHDLIDAIARPAEVSIEHRLSVVDGNQPLHKLLYDGRMIAFYEKFLGKPVGHYDHTWVRLCMPNQPATIPHCDVVYMGRGTHDLYTSWTPIGDAPIADGPLCVISRSHRIQKLRDHYCQTDVDAVCTNRQKPDGTKMMQNPTFGELSRNPPRMRKALGLPFLTTDYEAGDLLIFTVFTIHCALDNHGHRVRISTDTRYQAADEPQDDRWISIKGAPPTMHEEASRREMIC